MTTAQIVFICSMLVSLVDTYRQLIASHPTSGNYLIPFALALLAFGMFLESRDTEHDGDNEEEEEN